MVDYSKLVQKNACDAQEQVTQSIRDALALIRRCYEALGKFDNKMLEVLKREEDRLIDEAAEKLKMDRTKLKDLHVRRNRDRSVKPANRDRSLRQTNFIRPRMPGKARERSQKPAVAKSL